MKAFGISVVIMLHFSFVSLVQVSMMLSVKHIGLDLSSLLTHSLVGLPWHASRPLISPDLFSVMNINPSWALSFSLRVTTENTQILHIFRGTIFLYIHQRATRAWRRRTYIIDPRKPVHIWRIWNVQRRIFLPVTDYCFILFCQYVLVRMSVRNTLIWVIFVSCSYLSTHQQRVYMLRMYIHM